MEYEQVDGVWAFTSWGEIYPLYDLRVHVLNDDGLCWYSPSLGEGGGWVHHSADGRECYERGERRPH